MLLSIHTSTHTHTYKYRKKNVQHALSKNLLCEREKNCQGLSKGVREGKKE